MITATISGTTRRGPDSEHWWLYHHGGDVMTNLFGKVTNLFSKELPERLSWCEPVWASPTSAHHIRAVPAGQDLVVGGGLNEAALCGKSMDRGWDTHVLTDAATLQRTLDNAHATNRTCPECAKAAFAWFDEQDRSRT